MRDPLRVALLALVLATACRAARVERDGSEAPAVPADLGLGRAATTAQVAAWDQDVNPAGVGLPAGRGTPAEGAKLFAAKCAMCHGPQGQGILPAFPQLVGHTPGESFPDGNDVKRQRNIGNYWPYATTVYDYIHRAMPLTAPGSLTPDEIYSLTAYLLAANAVVPQSAVIDARTLPQVRMPMRDKFVRDDRKGGPEVK